MKRPLPFGRRTLLLVTLAVAGGAAYARLGVGLADLAPSEGGLTVGRAFLSAAIRPALDYEAAASTALDVSFLARLGSALLWTVVYAAAALSLALGPGLLLGCLASASFWNRDPAVPSGRSGLARLCRATVRVSIAALRSVHELLWAALLLAAMGVSEATGVLALAVPLTGTLAKVFSELLDEAPPAGAASLGALGARASSAFAFGRLPAAGADMAAYAFYRFECAVRTSAVLGFFGLPTLGYYLRASFEENHYREVWTYLYALLAVVLLFEVWSSALRRRFVA